VCAVDENRQKNLIKVKTFLSNFSFASRTARFFNLRLDQTTFTCFYLPRGGLNETLMPAGSPPSGVEPADSFTIDVSRPDGLIATVAEADPPGMMFFITGLSSSVKVLNVFRLNKGNLLTYVI
jgi:hypothetical protein